jgi:hypothetical protein
VSEVGGQIDRQEGTSGLDDQLAEGVTAAERLMFPF